MNENTLPEENEELEEGPNETLPNSDPFNSELMSESFRKGSDVTPIKVSDIISRRLSDAATSDTPPNTLTFRDVMLSMLVPSSESCSDVESNSDEDEFLIVTKDIPEKTTADSSPPFASDADDDTPPQPPPRRHKSTARKHTFDHPIDSDSINDLNSYNQGTVEANDQRQDLMTAEVDGVDIDTIGNTDQVVSCIDQGEDTVILDVKGEANENIADGSLEVTPEKKHCGTSIEVGSDNDESLPNRDTVGCATGTPSTETSSGTTGTPNTETSDSTPGTNFEIVGSATGTPNAESDSSTTDTPQKATDMSYDDISMRLSLQLAEPQLDPTGNSSNFNQQTSMSLNEENENAEDIEKDEDVEEVEEEELPCQSLGGGAVPLTRVKCMVSMTTPRDARAHGASDCPSFVEFDMSVDGFGCLFLPAIAPQVSAGKVHLQLITRINTKP